MILDGIQDPGFDFNMEDFDDEKIQQLLKNDNDGEPYCELCEEQGHDLMNCNMVKIGEDGEFEIDQEKFMESEENNGVY